MHRKNFVESFLAFVCVSICLSTGLFGGTTVIRSALGQTPDGYEGLDILARAMTTIQTAYVEPVSSSQLVHDSIAGIVENLDPHSMWIDAETYDQVKTQTDGHAVSIGITVTRESDNILIDTVTPRGPAAIAGLMSQDQLLSIDGQIIDITSIEEIENQLAGQRGSEVVIAIRRGSDDLTFVPIRDEVVEISVHGHLIQPGLGYIQIERFSRRTAAEMALLLSDLSSSSPLSGIILDLRDNPGGLITEAVDVVDLFVSDGLIVGTSGRVQSSDGQYLATTSATDLNVPIAVLVNQGSASASELVAGSLRDHGIATLIGTPTYGKGSMQKVYEFQNGSALKLTVAKYFLPSGATIDPESGLEPDHLVETSAVHPVILELQKHVDTLDITDAQQRVIVEHLSQLALPVTRVNTGLVNGHLTNDPQFTFGYEWLTSTHD